MSRPDLILRGGAVIDGSGQPRRAADVAVAGDRIVAVGDLGAMAAAGEVDCAGLVVAPGFIDVHTHDDRYLLEEPLVPAKASQGVTTVVVGNCGSSLAPYTRPDLPKQASAMLDDPRWRFPTAGQYFEALDAGRPAINAAVLVGHRSLRFNCMDDLERPASAAEITLMRSQLREALDAGAIGISTGLFYPGAQQATKEEVAEIASEMRADDGIYTAHIRDEGDRLLESIEEAAEIGRMAGVQVILSHHKAAGRANFGKTAQSLPLIEKLRRTQRIGFDVYPYVASSTALLPGIVDRAERVHITWCKGRPEFANRDLDEVARELGGLSRAETARAVIPAGAIYFTMDEADVTRVVSHPQSMIGSDGVPWDSFPHPRLWGTFPRVLGRYARDQGLMSLEQAVHKMTGLPAAEFGFRDRGLVREGAFADLVLFDAGRISDRATFETPKQPAAGIARVLVNGETVWQDGASTGARPGRALRRQTGTTRGRAG
ncbi:amidohydrolase family protein [Stella sp.]|uniref:N-acyl-D-amino-acid deacylase family protein n=1 Tax=Stella sp. TaxID=2912054 RepID=UPI0035B0C3F5